MSNKTKLEEMKNNLLEARESNLSTIAMLEVLKTKTTAPETIAALNKTLKEAKRSEKNMAKVFGKAL